MSEESYLISPTVDLFIYDLREGLRQDSEQISLNRQKFWQKVYSEDELDGKLLNSLAAAESSDIEYVELLGIGCSSVKKFDETEPPIEGFYYPIQLKIDTYALQVDCSIASSYPPQPISRFQQIIQNVIEPRIHGQKGKLGQTWLVWGQLPEVHKDPEEIAKECYAKLSQNREWDIDLQGQGLLSGGTLFELWQLPTQLKSIGESYHLLIWLFPFRDSIESIEDRVAKIYFHLIHLFAYRSKVIWADYQARQLNIELKQDFKKVQEVINTLNQAPVPINLQRPNLLQLQSLLMNSLNILSRYTNNLSLLNSQSSTIRVNLENYHKRLDTIRKTNSESNVDIEFLLNFSKFFAIKRQAQIETDYTSLSPGLTLIENLISTIKGTIDIYQADIDRKLNNMVAILGIMGIGLATGQIASPLIVAQFPPEQGVYFFSTQAFYWSLGTVTVVSALTWSILRLLRSWLGMS
jgi:hypothetical protein